LTDLPALNDSFLQNFIGRTRGVSFIIEQLTEGVVDFLTDCFKSVLFQEVYFF